MRTQELIEACKELAHEAYLWHVIRQETKETPFRFSDEELQKKTAKGAWDKYAKAHGSLTMINKELSEEEDFGGQYKKMIEAYQKSSTKCFQCDTNKAIEPNGSLCVMCQFIAGGVLDE